MKINHNMSAVVTNAQLLKTEGGLAASMERLSSGLKINHAKDDPAGMAITNKMQAQIDGLAKASESASNGISVLQIADSALGEITDMLQRMRELSVQAATDTNQLEEREKIQEEIESLVEEVDRISRDTEYNTKKLLNGTSDTRVYGDKFSRMSISDTVRTGEYKMSVDAAATQASLLSNSTDPNGTGVAPAGKVVINGMEIPISEGESAESVFEKLREGAELGDVSLVITDGTTTPEGGYTALDKEFAFGDQLAFVSNQYGVSAAVEISCSNKALEQFLGLGTTATPGKDAEITLDRSDASAFGAQATISLDGNKVKITDINGFEMNILENLSP